MTGTSGRRLRLCYGAWCRLILHASQLVEQPGRGRGRRGRDGGGPGRQGDRGVRLTRLDHRARASDFPELERQRQRDTERAREKEGGKG